MGRTDSAGCGGTCWGMSSPPDPGRAPPGSHAPCRHHGRSSPRRPHLNLSRVAATMTGSGTPCIHSSTGLWISRPMWLTKVIPLDNTGRRNDKGTPWAKARATWSAWTSPRASTTPRPRGCAGSGARSAHSTPTIRLPCRCTRPRSTSRIRWPPRTRRSWSWPSTGASGLPRFDWEPCVDGCCLQWSEIEQSNTAVSELSYIVDHFLRPHATASKDGRADFAPFIFNHRVDGTIAALRGDSRECRASEVV